MSDSVFLDTNILVYLYSVSEPRKRSTSISLFKDYNCVTSTQALKEFCNVFIKKYGMPNCLIKTAVASISKSCLVQYVSEDTITNALDFNKQYGYSYYDCLMLVSAFESNCDVIFSEDMGDGHVINNKLKIVNPYKNI